MVVDGNGVVLLSCVDGGFVGGDDVGSRASVGIANAVAILGVEVTCADGGIADDDVVGNTVAILNVGVACDDVGVRGVADNDDGNAVAILDVEDACDNVDAVAILDFEDHGVDFVIADGGDACADDAGAVGMGRGSGARPWRLPILILCIVFFRKLVGM